MQCRRPGFDPWVGIMPWSRAWQPTPIFLPGESPWAEESGQLQFMGSQRVRHNHAIKHTAQKASTEINYFVFKINIKLTSTIYWKNTLYLQYHIVTFVINQASNLRALSGFSSSIPENTGLQSEWFPWSLSHWAWIKMDIFYSPHLQHCGKRRCNSALDSFKRFSLNLLYIKWVLN